MLQCQTLPLCFPRYSVAPHCLYVFHRSILPPLAGNDVVFFVLNIDPWWNILAASKKVVEADARQDDLGYRLWGLLHGAEENSESVGQDAKGVFNHEPSSGKPVIEDPLTVFQFPP